MGTCRCRGTRSWGYGERRQGAAGDPGAPSAAGTSPAGSGAGTTPAAKSPNLGDVTCHHIILVFRFWKLYARWETFALFYFLLRTPKYTPQKKLGTTKCKGYNFNNFIASNKTNVGIK